MYGRHFSRVFLGKVGRWECGNWCMPGGVFRRVVRIKWLNWCF